MSKEVLKEIIERSDSVKTLFHMTGGNGVPVSNTISGQEFEEWLADIKALFIQVNSDSLTDTIIDLTDSFNGWSDEKNFEKLTASLKAVYKNKDIYFPGMTATLSKESLVMGYDAKVFNVMIASPGDVKSERAIVRDVIYEWNAVHSKSRKIVLLPIGWETHSSPEMGTSPQEIINIQVLDKCDVLVGVFWTRLGTPTKEFDSGTVEEIEKHIGTGKPTMLYFSSQPVAIDTVDLEQLKALKEFKESCKNRGLFESYDNYSDFKEKFYRHLQLKLNEHSIFQSIDSVNNNEVVESQVQIPALSQEATVLLKQSSLDSNGSVLLIRHLGGTDLQTNGQNLISSNERREIARWETALEELLSNQLLIERGNNGEVFEITDFGYQIADMIQL